MSDFDLVRAGQRDAPPHQRCALFAVISLVAVIASLRLHDTVTTPRFDTTVTRWLAAARSAVISWGWRLPLLAVFLLLGAAPWSARALLRRGTARSA